jgi:tetratricopeptide (TPR) repeat protein
MNKLPYYYKGVIHEFLECRVPARNQAILKGVYNVPIQDSSRNMDEDKIRKDAAVLEEIIKTEKDPYMLARYTFYLAQSYRDCGEPEEAIRVYADRMKLQGWDQEKYVSLIQSAMLKELLDYPAPEILNQYMTAREICPHRAEDLYRAARYCYTHNRPNMAVSFIKQAMCIPHPVEGLFLEDWLWQFGLKDALMVCEHQLGNNKESLKLARELLNIVPSTEKERIRNNITYLEKALKERKQTSEDSLCQQV